MESYQSLAVRPDHLGLVNFDPADLSLGDSSQALFPAGAFFELTKLDA